MIRCSIDIGTNSVLLLVAEVDGERLRVLHEEQRMPRLGRGVDSSKTLSESAQKRVIGVLTEYKTLLLENYPDVAGSVIVTATSAVRDASNRAEFIQKIKRTTGWNVRLLSGAEEAQVTYKGALAVLNTIQPDEQISVLDIGGGSTEIATGRGERLEAWDSLDMGSVRFTERFLKSDPPESSQVEAARQKVREMLEGWKAPSDSPAAIVGVAGTVTSMAAIQLELKSYNPKKINGHRLTHVFVEEKIDYFSSIHSKRIEKEYPHFMKGRGDVITGGLIILSEIMTYCGCDEIFVSTGGIRHGILTGRFK